VHYKISDITDRFFPDLRGRSGSAQSCDQAIKALMEGKMAFCSMGDWADGEFFKANMKEKADVGWVSHPGTDGSFIVVADGFTLAKGAPHKDAAFS
jgi:glucose/mannose transport system substrate-binding protein